MAKTKKTLEAPKAGEAPAPTVDEKLAAANAEAVEDAQGPDDGPLDEAKLADEAATEAKAELEAELADDAEVTASDKIKLALKEKMKADYKEKMRPTVLADLQAEALKDAKEELAADAEAEAKAEMEAEKKKDEPDDTWAKKPNAEITRIFRVARYVSGIPFRENIHTLMRHKSTNGMTTIEALSQKIKPTPANQYILKKGAIDYQDQLVALRNHEEAGVLKEIDPKFLGVPYISKEMKELKAAEDLVAKLRAQQG